MANFIRVGDKVINLDQITDVVLESSYQPGQVRIISVNGGTDFKGEEAAALRFFFTEQSTDVTKLYQENLVNQEFINRKTDWTRRFHAFADSKEVSSFAGELDSFGSFLYDDGEMNAPTEEKYQEWKTWFDEVRSAGVYKFY
jgi:hypothetical protein